ncbi:BtrH N-terminal domain-containing protein [Umezawaea endophytica]|uniref:BtrH N-terminal domain-containing protein n=1 Tax=Umezawaea endophytica TaxID=1654476 RepID=A0A9X3A6H7_9PSEU|nr:BtrH N-terminal domain-containing protein [Umezawaea endophytica]MCS7483403.1 BtrH N-terminal domain-containing protein [Umezawaea endophytica]
MTERKSFKHLVRSRMARTGESYSTARRRLLGEQAVRTGGGTQHESALLRNVLGGRASEPMLAGLAGGIGFMYFVFEYAGHHPTMTIVSRHHPDPYIPAALRRAGIEHTTTRTTSARKAEAGLREALAGGPVICVVDRAKLPWHGLTGQWGPEPHSVGVLGIDGGTVLLDDECVRPNPLPLADFLAAWSSKHEMTTVGAGWRPDVEDAIGTTCAHLTGPVLGNNFDVNFGFSGMRKLAAQLRDPKGKQGWARRYADPGALFFALRRLHDCLEVEHGGPSATRPLYADFLREVGRPGAAELFDASGALWSEVAARAVSATPALAEYDDLVTERLRLLLHEGAAGADAIRALTGRVDALEARMIADPPRAEAVRELFDRLADDVDSARVLEERAVELLAGR